MPKPLPPPLSPPLPLPSFPFHPPDSALMFPRDEGWHRFLPLMPLPGQERGLANPSLDEMEWVYLNAHVDEVGGTGRRFVVFASYFAQALRFLVVRGWDASGQSIGTWTGTAWGLLTASPDHLDLEFAHAGGKDTWTTQRTPAGALRPFASHLIARDDAATFTVDLLLESQKPPYPVGGVGWLPFGTRGSFNYYSLTRQTASGVLALRQPSGTTESIPVEGLGWFDHQWGPFFITPFRIPGLDQYEWMSIQLDSGDEFMLTTVWDERNQTPSGPAYGGAGWIRANGTTDRVARSNLWQRTGFWQSPEQEFVYSSGWRLDVPEWDVHLVITPRQQDQLTPIIDPPVPGVVGDIIAKVMGAGPNFLGEFWEGSCEVTGTIAGAPVQGVAFAELIKRYDQPRLELRVLRQQPGFTAVSCEVKDPDAQVTLCWDADLFQDVAQPPIKSWLNSNLPFLSIDHTGLPRGVPLTLRVKVHSTDQVLSTTEALTLTLP